MRARQWRRNRIKQRKAKGLDPRKADPRVVSQLHSFDILKFFKEETGWFGSSFYKLNMPNNKICKIEAHGYSTNKFFVIPEGINLYLAVAGGVGFEILPSRMNRRDASTAIGEYNKNSYIREYSEGSLIQDYEISFDPFIDRAKPYWGLQGYHTCGLIECDVPEIIAADAAEAVLGGERLKRDAAK